GEQSYAYFTNCLITGSGAYLQGPIQAQYDSANVKWLTSDAGVFQSTGAGAFYLPANSPYRNAGTTGINPNLAADIKTRTTTPPMILGNLISINSNLSPQTPRDLD